MAKCKWPSIFSHQIGGNCAIVMSELHLFIISLFILPTFASIKEAWIIFNVGKNCDGFFGADNLLQQVNKTINIFEGLTKGWASLFICSTNYVISM